MAALKVFISYSSKDEILRGELEKHLALLKRENIIETWTFRNIEAGDVWRAQIDVRLEAADIILLLVSSDFIASDYCWNVEMRRAVERHREQSARLVPIILRDCDWNSAPFAAIQVLPPGAKAVANWKPHDKAWKAVAETLRRLATTATANNPAADGTPMTPESIAQRAQRLAADSTIRRNRAEKLRNEGHGAWQREYQTVFQQFDNLTAQIRDDTPGVRIQSGWHPDHAIVRREPLTRDIYPLTLNCYPRPSESNIEDYGLVARLLFGGMVLPQERNIFYPDRPKEHVKREYKFRLSATNQWCWLDHETQSLVTSDELANRLIAELLQLYDDIESGKVPLPSFW